MVRIKNYSPKKISVIEWYSTACFLGVGLGLINNIYIYLYLVHGGSSPIFFYGLFILTACIAIFIQPTLIVKLINERLFYWFIFYSVSGIVWYLVNNEHTGNDTSAWRKRILFGLIFCSGFILAMNVKNKLIFAMLAVSAVLVTFTYWHDFLNPLLYVPLGHEASNAGRGSGFFMNANQAGNALIVISIALLPFVDLRWRSTLILLMIIGVLPTFSRSSILLALLVTAIWLGTGQLRKISRLGLGVIILILSVFLFYFIRLDFNVDGIDFDRLRDRLNFFLEFGEANDFSANERRYVLRLALERFINAPLGGIGVGVTGMGSSGFWGYGQSTHNMYLLMLVEQGFIGGFLYLIFIGLIISRGLHAMKTAKSNFSRDLGVAIIAIGVYFAFLGFFSQTLLEESVGLLSLSILLACDYKNRRLRM